MSMDAYRLRVIYEKMGISKFISGKNLVRHIERCLRRTNFSLKYTEGFNPHPKLSFGPALPVNIEGENEILDIYFVEKIDDSGKYYYSNDTLKKEIAYVLDTIYIRGKEEYVYYQKYTERGQIISDSHIFYQENNTKNKYIMFRFQVSGSNNLQQSLVTDSLKGVKSKIRNEEFKTDNIKMNYNQDTEIFIGGIEGTNKDNSFTAGDTFKFKYMPIKDVNKDDFSNIKYKEEKIVKIDYLVVPTLNNKGDKQKLSLVDIDKPTFGKNDLDMKGHTDKVIQEFKKLAFVSPNFSFYKN